MIFTYLILRLALEGVTEECNRLAAEQYSREYAAFLKARLAELTIDYEAGRIDAETFEKKQRDLLGEMGGESTSAERM